ncbi:MAG TPA: hypothetical protein VHT24_11360 [Pseudacidobacterium sp.]|jgi:hypothetical protein|nr:hypothetical protein [Pseudacidobacterium sp.]
MRAFHIVFAIYATATAICGFAAFAIANEMLDKLNRVLPEENQFSPMWWGPMKYVTFVRAYRQVFPQDTLLFWYRVTLYCGFAIFIVCTSFLFWYR